MKKAYEFSAEKAALHQAMCKQTSNAIDNKCIRNKLSLGTSEHIFKSGSFITTCTERFSTSQTNIRFTTSAQG